MLQQALPVALEVPVIVKKAFDYGQQKPAHPTEQIPEDMLS